MALEIRFYSFFQNIKYFQTEKPDLLHCCNFFYFITIIIFCYHQNNIITIAVIIVLLKAVAPRGPFLSFVK